MMQNVHCIKLVPSIFRQELQGWTAYIDDERNKDEHKKIDIKYEDKKINVKDEDKNSPEMAGPSIVFTCVPDSW